MFCSLLWYFSQGGDFHYTLRSKIFQTTYLLLSMLIIKYLLKLN